MHTLALSLRVWLSHVCEIASPLFFKHLLQHLGLKLFLKVHLLKPPVLIFQLFHTQHHGHFNPTVIGAPLVKRRATDACTLRIWGTGKQASTRLTASIIFLLANFDLFMGGFKSEVQHSGIQ
jgi:hypothetical protein